MTLFETVGKKVEEFFSNNDEIDNRDRDLSTTYIAINVNHIGLSSLDSVKLIKFEAIYEDNRYGEWIITQDNSSIKVANMKEIVRFIITINIICKFGMMNLLSTSHLHKFIFDRSPVPSTIKINMSSQWRVGNPNTTTVIVNDKVNEIRGGKSSMQLENEVIIEQCKDQHT
jgi:hypothetical protein